ncbi:hydantoinase B/oxoprolinase family protein [soil metagenome]
MITTTSAQDTEPKKMNAIRFEVMRNAFAAAADEMGAALRKAAFSTNIKTRADFSCALYDAHLRVIAQSFSQPIHLASMSRFVPAAVQQYGVSRLQPGDGIVMNHPHHGAMHLNDIAVIIPFYHEGALAGYSATIAHHVDIGGMAPGGLCISRDIYQEGIIIPATKLVEDGQILDGVFNLITANIRSQRQMRGDFRAQIAASLLGQRRMEDIIARFGFESVEEFTDELIDYTQRWTKAEIAKLPEGEYTAEGYLDDDGVTDVPIRLAVRAIVRDSRVIFDLTGSDAQRSSPMNANLTYSYAALSYVVKCLLHPDIPTNGGFYAQIEVTAPPGTVVNATPPVGVVGGAEVAIRLCDLGFKAFAQALPDQIAACGKSVMCQMGCGGIDPATNDYYTHYETLAGGYGARPTKDGIDAVQAHIQNTENSSIEETEFHFPIQIRRYELAQDSEGAGRYRGGLGIYREWQFLNHRTTLTVFSDGRKFAPWGLQGGGDAACAQYTLNPEGENRDLPSKITLGLQTNAVISYRTPGGGGFGSALERDPDAVLRDVIDEKVSPTRARDVYGVALQGRTVDQEATAELRRNMSSLKARF